MNCGANTCGGSAKTDSRGEFRGLPFPGEISEPRIGHGPGYRVHFKDTGKEIILLPCGGDKSTQESDIARAREIAQMPIEGYGRIMMEKVTFERWDPADDIETKEDVIATLEAALEENDSRFLLSVISDIARSEGMTRIARELGVTREGLYQSLAPTGNPSFDTVLKLLDLLGFRLRVERKTA
jgi:probable addiction module antidote protein